MMKKITALFISLILIFSFAACKGDETDIHSQTAAGYADEENAVIVDPYVTVTADKEISGDDVACEFWQEGEKLHGFIMRFSKKTQIDSSLSDPANVYYALVTEKNGEKKVVPTEDIQISTDIKTNEYVIKMLYPTDKNGTFNVDFCLSERENAGDSMIFCAKSECTLP